MRLRLIFKKSSKKIVTFFLKLLIILTCTNLAAVSHGQPYVTFTIQVKPPYSSRVSDYISQPNKIMATILNTSLSKVNIYVQGSITGQSGISVYTDPSYKMPSSIELWPGVLYLMSMDNIEQVFNEDHLVYQGASRDDILFRKGLPEDIYTICLKAFNYETDELISNDIAQNCSNNFPVADLEPPVITSPVSGQDVFADDPQNVIFSWTWPPGAPVNTQFFLKIVEILPSDRNINDAFQSASHPIFFEKTVTSPQYLFGPADPPLVPGKSYAICVTAVDPSRNLAFRNNGMSEVGSFNYVKTEAVCGGLPVAWDVNSVRKINYSVTVESIGSEGSLTSGNYLVSLEFLGEGKVNCLSVRDGENSLLQCKMSPSGNLEWDKKDIEIPFPILFGLSPLPDPVRIITTSDTWTKYTFPDDSLSQYKEAFVQSYKGVYNIIPAIGQVKKNIINIEIKMFDRIEPTEAAKEFYQKHGVTDELFIWENRMNGYAYFNCSMKCLEKAEINVVPYFESQTPTSFLIERIKSNEANSKE